MQRYNGFNQIHKALRALLFNTSTLLLQTDPGDKEATAAVIERIATVIQLFHSHASHEDEFILPLLLKINPELVTRFESEHEEDESLSLHLSMLLLSFKNAVSAGSTQNIWNNICKAFYAFTAFNLYHMNKEEDQINPLLWAHFSDEEMLDVTKTIIANVDKEEMGLSNQWMLQGLNNTEIISWLNAVKNEAPEFVFNNLLQAAKAILPDGRFAAIENVVTSNNRVTA